MNPARFCLPPPWGTLLLTAAAILGWFPGSALAGEVAGHAGVLDRMGAGVRELGAANTGTASFEAMPAAYWNPALLAYRPRIIAGAGGELRALQRNGGFLALEGPVSPRLGLGLGVVDRGDLWVPLYDRDERRVGTARPQSFGVWLGGGARVLRRMSVGASVHWQYTSMDLDGSGDMNAIGFWDAGWAAGWRSGWRAGAVLRNLGLNSRLTASYDLIQFKASNPADLDRAGTDFLPRTLVAAVGREFETRGRKTTVAVELLDFQVADQLFTARAEDHELAMRAGLEYFIRPTAAVRGGYDRGNWSLGFGYRLPVGGRTLEINYALLAERGFLAISPVALDLRWGL